MHYVALLGLWLASCSLTDTENGDLRARERHMAELINIERDARGIRPLRFSPELSRVARAYSREMAAAGKVHHRLGDSMEERILEALPDTCVFGENVSKHTSVDYALGDLMQSTGHRANLLSPEFTESGVGIVRGPDDFLYITQEFRRPCAPNEKRRR